MQTQAMSLARRTVGTVIAIRGGNTHTAAGSGASLVPLVPRASLCMPMSRHTASFATSSCSRAGRHTRRFPTPEDNRLERAREKNGDVDEYGMEYEYVDSEARNYVLSHDMRRFGKGREERREVGRGRGAGMGKGKGKDEGTEERRMREGCFRCGSLDHQKRDCPEEAAIKTKMRPGCFRCGSLDHYIHDCPNKPVSRCHRCGQAGHISIECTNPPAIRTCYVCGEKGHIATDCPQKNDAQPKSLEREITWYVFRRFSDYAS
ncbi:hypothetical protein CPC08DRAFT_105346 [Agrocybe pediades]|nr:hypothetical protein CPC08DRAFT_105346 [Agrocybe pediades]